MRREARAQLRGELRRKRCAERCSAVAEVGTPWDWRWAWWPAAGPQGLLDQVAGCHCGGGMLRGGGVGVGLWGLGTRWGVGAGRCAEVRGPRPEAVLLSLPAAPRSSAPPDTHPRGRAVCVLAGPRRGISQKELCVTPSSGHRLSLRGKKSSSGLEIATESLITFCRLRPATDPFPAFLPQDDMPTYLLPDG